jgi:transcriptional regulator with XRE-family HTH domain
MKDFNNLKAWITQKLDERNMCVEDLAVKAGISRGLVYLWMQDRARPTYNTMPKVVRALSEAPVFLRGGKTELREISLEEAYAQYTMNKLGRPKGTGSGVKAVTTRGR